MPDQDAIDIAFTRNVAIVNRLRGFRKPALGALSVLGVWAFFWQPFSLDPLTTWSEHRWVMPIVEVHTDVALAEDTTDTVLDRELSRWERSKALVADIPRKLTKEQQALAQFLAKRYRVALDSTQESVDFAYGVAKDLKLDPWLILAIVGIESSFDPNAKSHMGAQGLMQVLTRVHADKFAPFGGAAAAFDPLTNIKVGARILRDYIDRDGSIENALKSYVGAAMMGSDSGYGEKVLYERARLKAAAEGRPFDETTARALARQGTRPPEPVTDPMAGVIIELAPAVPTVPAKRESDTEPWSVLPAKSETAPSEVKETTTISAF